MYQLAPPSLQRIYEDGGQLKERVTSSRFSGEASCILLLRVSAQSWPVVSFKLEPSIHANVEAALTSFVVVASVITVSSPAPPFPYGKLSGPVSQADQCCFPAIGAGDREYVCIDCLRDRNSTVNLCFSCNETNKGAHREPHSYQVVLYQTRHCDVDNWFEQSRNALVCNECSETLIVSCQHGLASIRSPHDSDLLRSLVNNKPFPPLIEHPHYTFTVRLNAACWDQIRHHVWSQCPKKGHLVYYPREIAIATVETCQCGEAIILNTITSNCFICRVSFCHMCVRAHRDFHRHPLIMCKPLNTDAIATYTCAHCGRSQPNTVFFGARCPSCNTDVCHDCLIKTGDHSRYCACANPPTMPRWFLARAAAKRTTYLPPTQATQLELEPPPSQSPRQSPRLGTLVPQSLARQRSPSQGRGFGP